MNLEAPNDLPGGLQHLSNSSIEQYCKCPERWRRKYLMKEYEPRQGHLILGSAIHAAENESYSDQVTSGEPHPLEQVMDDYRTGFELEVRGESEIDWGEMTQGETIDRGARLIGDYHMLIPRLIKPEKVETEFNIRLHPDHRWTIKGYIDIIGDFDDGGFNYVKGAVHDLKSVSRKMAQDDLDNSMQGTFYTYTRWLEGYESEEQTAPFLVHELKATKTLTESRIIRTERTREQGERLMERVASIAREIEWRVETDNWQGAPPGAWWCRPKTCGFYATCPMAVGRP